MPGGSTLDKTDVVVADIEKRLETIPEKQDIITRIEEGTATVTVNLSKDWKTIGKRTLPEIKNNILDKVSPIKNAEITMNDASSSGGGGGGSDMGDTIREPAL